MYLVRIVLKEKESRRERERLSKNDNLNLSRINNLNHEVLIKIIKCVDNKLLYTQLRSTEIFISFKKVSDRSRNCHRAKSKTWP